MFARGVNDEREEVRQARGRSQKRSNERVPSPFTRQRRTSTLALLHLCCDAQAEIGPKRRRTIR